MARFVISQTPDAAFHFTLRAGNGEVMMSSEGYKSKDACEDGIANAKANSHFDERFKKMTSISQKRYFTLKAENGDIIGTSEMYESVAGRDNGIAAVKSNAATAYTDDQTHN